MEEDNFTYRIPRSTRDDLAMLSCAAPFMFTRLDAAHSDTLICTDASDDYLGAVEAGIDSNLHRELWRVRDRKGWSSHLVGGSAEYIYIYIYIYILARGGEKEADELEAAIVSSWEEARSAGSVEDPKRALVETFDYLEVCCGRKAVMISACSAKGLRCGPRIDILTHSSWDVRSTRVVEWLIFLVHGKRVFHMHFGAPCTTFSIARTPKSRTKDMPLGKARLGVKEAAIIRDGNLMLLRTMLVLFCIYFTGVEPESRWVHGSHEHPASAYSWYIPSVDKLFQHEGCTKITVSYCQFGALYRKNTTIGCIYTNYFEKFRGRICRGGHQHVRLEGGLCTSASEYPPGLCEELSESIRYARVMADEDILADSYGDNSSKHRPGAFERLYFNEILESAEWSFLMQEACGRKTGRAEHINILEVRAQLRTVAQRGAKAFKKKQIYGMDSQVGLGALSKGRSPSLPINEELRRGLPHIVGCQHYPGYMFAPTRLNPGDCPSRNQDLPAPRAMPQFLADVAAGSIAEFEAWTQLPLQCRSVSNWARFVVRLRRPQALSAWPW